MCFIQNLVDRKSWAYHRVFMKKQFWNCGFLEVVEICKNETSILCLNNIDALLNVFSFCVGPNHSAPPTLFCKKEFKVVDSWYCLEICKLNKYCLRIPRYNNKQILSNQPYAFKNDWLFDEHVWICVGQIRSASPTLFCKTAFYNGGILINL